MRDFLGALVFVSLATLPMQAAELPARYYRLMEAGCAGIQKHLDELPNADLKTVEKDPESHTGSSLEKPWAHFGYAILPPAVLYSNAAYQWLEGHIDLFPKLMALLPPGQ